MKSEGPKSTPDPDYERIRCLLREVGLDDLSDSVSVNAIRHKLDRLASRLVDSTEALVPRLKKAGAGLPGALARAALRNGQRPEATEGSTFAQRDGWTEPVHRKAVLDDVSGPRLILVNPSGASKETELEREAQQLKLLRRYRRAKVDQALILLEEHLRPREPE